MHNCWNLFIIPLNIFGSVYSKIIFHFSSVWAKMSFLIVSQLARAMLCLTRPEQHCYTHNENIDILFTQAQSSLHTSFNFTLPRCRHKQNGLAICEKINGKKFINVNCSLIWSAVQYITNEQHKPKSRCRGGFFFYMYFILLLVDFLNIYI